MKKKIISYFTKSYCFLLSCVYSSTNNITMNRKFRFNGDMTVSSKEVEKTLEISRRIILNIEEEKFLIHTFKFVLSYNESGEMETSIDGKKFISCEATLFYLRSTAATLKILEYLAFINLYIFGDSKEICLKINPRYKEFKDIIDQSLSTMFFDISDPSLTSQASKKGKDLIIIDYDKTFLLENKSTGLNYVINYYQCGLYFLISAVREMLKLDYEQEVTEL